MHPKRTLIYVILFSILITLCLTQATWRINFWPTDAYYFYFDAAVSIPRLDYISEIHDHMDVNGTPWLHGKEMFILLSSWFQRLLNDFETLRPLILVCLISFCISSILVYVITSRLWGILAGLACYFCFMTSFWPYVYILFVKHQPLGLMFFLVAIFLLFFVHIPKWGKTFFLLSGAAISTALFSSTVSTLYLPYYLAAFLYICYSNQKKKYPRFRKRELLLAIVLAYIGALGVFVFFNYPDIGENIRGYYEYVKISSSTNHFYHNQPVLQQWIPENVDQTRGGWVWIAKYFLLVMPVLFPGYLICLIFLIFKSLGAHRHDFRFQWITLSFILLSLSSPILAEVKGVAQYGANYFSSFVGILLLIGYTVHVLILEEEWRLSKKSLKIFIEIALILICFFQVVINSAVFFGDVYPTRMATTFLSSKIKQLKISKIYTYKKHPHNIFITQQLDPDLTEKLEIEEIDHILQPTDGYILVPPPTKDSICIAAHSDYTQFDNDIFLNELLRKGNLKDYAIAAYPTLASSQIWSHEAEILTYRYLVLNQFFREKETLGKVWLLDAQKLQKDKVINLPQQDYIHLARDQVRNIGTQNRAYLYRGVIGVVKDSFNLRGFMTRIYKVGKPDDSLIAYVYHLDERKPPVWVPYENGNSSYPIEAQNITAHTDGGLVRFEFPQPFVQKPGLYLIKIYRSGRYNDENYYRIYTKYQQRMGN